MKFRIARHTNKLDSIVDFYTHIIGLDKLGEFVDHDGYNGVFIGRAEKDWHLEFTSSNTDPKHIFDEDDILVFYPENKLEYEALLARINTNNITRKIPKNPYWKENGFAFSDPDGYIIVVSPLKIKAL